MITSQISRANYLIMELIELLRPAYQKTVPYFLMRANVEPELEKSSNVQLNLAYPALTVLDKNCHILNMTDIRT